MTFRGIVTASIVVSAVAPVSAQTLTEVRAPARELLYLEVVLNGVATGRLMPVVRDQGQLTATASDLASFGLSGDAASEQVPLDQLRDGVVRYDALAQRLHIDRPASLLPGQHLSAGHTGARIDTRSSSGVLFNYDVAHQRHSGGTQATAAWLEGRTFGRLGILSTTARYQRRAGLAEPAASAFIRQDTTWTKTNRDRRVVFSAGDVVTGAHTWGRAIRVGGVSIARNFGLRPDLVTYPMPEFAGEAAVPGAVELLLNGRRVMEEEVAPGPFAIRDVPIVNGAGVATIVTTDAVGRQTTRSVPFYVSTSLLKPGLLDYSVTVGAVRRGYGLESFDYGAPIATGVARYGATTALTVEGLASVTGTSAAGGAGASVRVGYFGVAGASITASNDSSSGATRTGYRHTLRYEYQATRFGLLVRRDAQSAGFTEPGLTDISTTGGAVRPAEDLLQMFLSINYLRSTPVAFGYIRADGRSGPATVFTVSASRSIAPRQRLALSAARRSGAWSVDASLTMHLGSSAAARVGTAGNGSALRATLHRPAPVDGGIGVGVAASSDVDDERHGTVTWRTSAFDLEAGVDARRGVATTWTSARGSVVAAGRTVMATGRVNDAFIIVDTNGVPGVPVLFENRRIGATNRRGRLLVPGVTAYHTARVSIDPLHLPLDVQAAVTEQHVAVERHAGTVVSFPLRRTVSATIRLVDAEGAPLPVGARVVHQQSGSTFVTGWTGLVYIDHVTSENTLTVTREDGRTCTVSFASLDLPLRYGAVSRQTCR